MVHQLPQVSKCFFKRCFGNHCNFTWISCGCLGWEIQRPVFYGIHLSNMHDILYLFPGSLLHVFRTLISPLFNSEYILFCLQFLLLILYPVLSQVISCITDLCGYLCLKMCIFWEINAIFSHQKKNQFLRVTSMSAWRL